MTGQDPEQPRGTHAARSPRQPPDDPQQLLDHLHELVVERFARLTGLTVVTAPMPASSRATDDLPPASCHPECEGLAESGYCRRKWQRLREELRDRPEVHWDRCEFGKLCAIVPVVWDGTCVAICQLVTGQSQGEEAFEREVELLDVLVENCLAREKGFLGDEDSPSPPKAPRERHEKVTEALEHIDSRLRAHDLTVAGVARALSMNPSYLAHLFTQQTGVRMGRYIAERRITLAKKLLRASDDQIKRIAAETGFANADWFSHLFHVHTGMTPTEYRNAAGRR